MVSSTTGVTLDEWSHIAVTVDATAQRVEILIDGVSVAAVTTFSPALSIVTASTASDGLIIGGQGGGPSARPLIRLSAPPESFF